MLRYATGVDMITVITRAMVGDPIAPIEQRPYNGHWAEIILHADTDGIFQCLEISPSLPAEIIEEDLWVRPGDHVDSFEGANNAIGTLVLKFQSAEELETAITPRTTAIMPVHVYGKPCNTQAIQDIADKYGLRVIYDAAHAFGVEVDGQSLLNAGDISTLSFHATKVYNTVEGGAMVMHDEKTKRRIDYLKNFGFAGETEVVAPGINSKMDEIRAAYGLLNLRQVVAAIEARHQVAIRYREALRNVPGIEFWDDLPGVKHNYSYFPIFVHEEEYGESRDQLYFRMRGQGIFGRRYFYPLISEFSTYRSLDSARPDNLPVAHRMANSVICLPMHHNLSEGEVERVIENILKR